MACLEAKKNMGITKCNDLPQLFKGMITTPPDFSIPAATLADPELLLEYLQDAIKDGAGVRIYFWPKFVGMEDNSEDAVYEETPLSDEAVRDGKYRWRVFIKKSMCIHKAMFTHAGNGDRVIFWDVKNQLFLTELSTGDGAGFTMSLLKPEKLKISDGSVSTKSPVYVVLEDNEEVDKNGIVVDGDVVRELVPLSDVDVTVSVVDSDNVDITVKRTCDGVPVSGLGAGDFVILDNSEVVQVPDSITETPSGSGVYRAVKAANFVDGTVDLEAASDLTIDAYESTGPATMNIP